MKMKVLSVVGMVIVALAATQLLASEKESGISPDGAMRQLQEGNTRYATDAPLHPRAEASRRNNTAEHGQNPFATVIACSDSRVPVEILFDQGIGDLFVIRVAGNVCDQDEIGSIEYGVDHLGTPLMVVLGHTGCGAVTAVATDAELHGSIPTLVDNIRPAVQRAKAAHPDLHGKDLVPAAVEANVWQSIEDLLRHSPATRERIAAGKLKVVGAIYDLDTGRVKWLGEHPDREKIMAHGDAGHETGPKAGHE